jgi:hypothetical protein
MYKNKFDENRNEDEKMDSLFLKGMKYKAKYINRDEGYLFWKTHYKQLLGY